MIKFILLDIDGTLTNSKRQITPETHAALMRAQEAGVRLVLSSGRPVRGLDSFADRLDMRTHHGLYIAYNGAHVMDCETREVWFNQAIPSNDARDVLHHMHRFPSVRAMIDRNDLMYVEDVFDCYVNYDGPFLPGKNGQVNIYDYEAHGNGFDLCEMHDMAARLNWDPNKILMLADPAYLQAHYQELAAPFKGRLASMFTSPFYYEFTPLGIDKARAISEAFEPRGFAAHDMIAFGDGQNDRTMLEYVGIGVAMANAVDELKESADEITDSNEEDGIAHSLYRHLPEIFG